MAAFTGTKIDDKPRADTVVGTDHAWGTHAFKGEILGTEPLIGAAGGNSSDRSGAFESMTRPHADGLMLLHGDFSTLVDTGGTIVTDNKDPDTWATDAAAGDMRRLLHNTEGDEPTLEFNVPADTRTGTAFAGDGLGSSHSVVGDNAAGSAAISDGTSNTIMFRNITDRDATDNVIESVGTKYTYLETMAEDECNFLHANSDGHLPRGNILDVGDLLIGFDAAVGNVVDDARTSNPDGSAPIQADRGGQAGGGVSLDVDVFSGGVADHQTLPTDIALPLD